jgi:hypothetical protein
LVNAGPPIESHTTFGVVTRESDHFLNVTIVRDHPPPDGVLGPVCLPAIGIVFVIAVAAVLRRRKGLGKRRS